MRFLFRTWSQHRRQNLHNEKFDEEVCQLWSLLTSGFTLIGLSNKPCSSSMRSGETSGLSSLRISLQTVWTIHCRRNSGMCQDLESNTERIEISHGLAGIRANVGVSKLGKLGKHFRSLLLGIWASTRCRAIYFAGHPLRGHSKKKPASLQKQLGHWCQMHAYYSSFLALHCDRNSHFDFRNQEEGRVQKQD